MPNVETHDLINSFAVLPLSVGSYMVLRQQEFDPDTSIAYTALFIAGHLIGTVWMSPDLDIDSAIDDRWGPLFWIWRPYMWAMPHRRVFSHSGVSAILRLLYLYLVLGCGVILLSLVLNAFGIVSERTSLEVIESWLVGVILAHPRITLAFVLGLVVSDLLHTLVDYLSTGGKRFLRFFGIRIRRDWRGHDRWRG
jgi:uncharacterized metal-binding protein